MKTFRMALPASHWPAQYAPRPAHLLVEWRRRLMNGRRARAVDVAVSSRPSDQGTDSPTAEEQLVAALQHVPGLTLGRRVCNLSRTSTARALLTSRVVDGGLIGTGWKSQCLDWVG